MTTLRFILTPLVAIMLPLVAGSSHAGIVVTVGRVPSADLLKKSKVPAGGYQTDSNGDRMCVVTVDGRTNCPMVAQIDPMTGLPAGWMCRPLGANQFYCDDPGRGGAADGVGEAGAFDEAGSTVDNVDGDEEIQNFGCEAGGGGFGVVAALGALGALAFRRRAAAR